MNSSCQTEAKREQIELILSANGYLVFEACSVLLSSRDPDTRLDFGHSLATAIFRPMRGILKQNPTSNRPAQTSVWDPNYLEPKLSDCTDTKRPRMRKCACTWSKCATVLKRTEALRCPANEAGVLYCEVTGVELSDFFVHSAAAGIKSRFR